MELYDGEAQAAWRVIGDGWQNYTSSLLSYVQQVRIDFLGTCGRAALAAAAGSRDRAILARARAIARRLEGENARWAGALALMLRGGLANLADDRRAAADYLSRAVESFQAIPMHLYATAVRWQLGRLQGAAAGAGLCQEAEHEMRVLGIRNPVRMANALVTGFGTNASAGDAGYSPRPGRGDVAGNSEQNTDY